MRYVLYGAGGIGAGIGGQLFGVGREVVLIARGPHLERLRSAGLSLHDPEGKRRQSIPAVGHPREIDFTADDVVLLTMKSQDTAAAVAELRTVAGSSVPVICAQNGVVNERFAARRFERVYGMVVWMPATFLEPGTVLLHGTPLRGVLDIGRFPSGTDPLVERACADLEAAGFSARPDPAIMAVKYGKLLANLGNAVQALCGLEADTRPLLRALRREAYACYEAAGLDFVPLRDLVNRVERGMEMGEIDGAPRQGGSTWQSLMRGAAAVETDYLNGEIVLLGAQHGVPTPLNRAVQELAIAAAAAGRSPGSTGVAEIEARARALGAGDVTSGGGPA